MPDWLRQQLRRAYHKKDRTQIKILNQCWFYYKEKSDVPIKTMQK
ncbi:cortex morphogenetic protein CmpA [Bacillus suaedae]|uniref:Cortex morphogenetic protein CmpA n=1 Tax=Halalkalibacter suaedae TaxID=2822140 RepID=A0A941ARU9_9BACI|nr:cortex morphogenetic protein CmpA [Bacillus suaedae]MBP3953293.1 cortex morphogenetic protein CmpA [Bacillus suaedae]